MATAAAADPGDSDSLDGQSVVRVTTTSQEQLDAVLRLTDDVWSESYGIGPLDIRVTPEQRAGLEREGIPYRVMIPDIGAEIRRQAETFAPRTPPFTDYGDFPTLVAYMNTLAGMRPDLAEVVNIGATVQNRPIWMIRVHGPDAPPRRRAVFYNGCQHAREWISPPVTLYIADQLIRNYDTDPAIAALLSRVTFCLVPVVNSDGYVYTWQSQNTRLWRKNRRRNPNGSYGIDLNRNWSVGFGGPGSSGSQGSDTYRGPSAFSEPETAALSAYMTAHPEIVASLDIHSYSQLILWPWGYQQPVTPDEPTFSAVGGAMRDLILAVHGMTYRPGATYDNIYPASGIASDWSYGARRIWGFSFELRDTGDTGFLLPASQILPNCEEILPAALYLADRFPLPGDVNGDAIVDAADITPFIEVLLQLNADPGAVARADVNLDGAANADDIGPFVERLFLP